MGKEILFGRRRTIPCLIALNWGKGWYKKYEGDFVEQDVAAWMDAVKMGEGKKISIPMGDNVKAMFGIDDLKIRCRRHQPNRLFPCPKQRPKQRPRWYMS